jgi:hypothetical protein
MSTPVQTAEEVAPSIDPVIELYRGRLAVTA